MVRLFIAPFLISIVALFAVYQWGGMSALLLALVLSVVEISLSFDNAVINAKVLMQMEEKWRQRFLTWGMVIAVLGTRLIFPALLVSAAAGISPFIIAQLAFYNPVEYARLLTHAQPAIHALGGAFLLMVALKYFFDEAKSLHWIGFVERRLALWGKIDAVEVTIVLILLLVCSWLVPANATTILQAGSIGIVLFVLMEGLISVLGFSTEHAVRDGLVLFVYLNLLDAAFSFDGVIGAFALTTQLFIIVVGLSIGAYFVRTFTIALVRKRTLSTLIYLEHGAYWAIGALALFMFAGLLTEVSDVIVGSISILVIAAAYASSVRARRLHPPATL